MLCVPIPGNSPQQSPGAGRGTQSLTGEVDFRSRAGPDASAWGAPGKGPARLGNQGLAAPRGRKPYLPARNPSPDPPPAFCLFPLLLLRAPASQERPQAWSAPHSPPPAPRSLPEPAPPRKPEPSIPVCGWKPPLSCQVTGKSALGSPGEPGAEETSWSSRAAGLPRPRPIALPQRRARGLRTETALLSWPSSPGVDSTPCGRGWRSLSKCPGVFHPPALPPSWRVLTGRLPARVLGRLWKLAWGGPAVFPFLPNPLQA